MNCLELPSVLSQQPERYRRSGAEVVGHSVEGRPIDLIRFPLGSTVENLDTLLVGAIHGDEVMSAAVLCRLVEALRQGTWHTLTPEKPFGIVPVLNPDGLYRNQRPNARGVDLNRNWPTRNFEVQGEGTPYFGGHTPLSEPESQLLANLLERFTPKKIVMLHTPYRVVNYDGAQSLPLAQKMSALNRYPVVADIGYPTPGSFGNYAGIEREYQIITLELDEIEPLEQVWQQNWKALWAAIHF